MAVKKDQHVVRSADGNWAVRSTGAEKASKAFLSKDLAINYARTLARSASTGLYIHDEDGRVLVKEDSCEFIGDDETHSRRNDWASHSHNKGKK